MNAKELGAMPANPMPIAVNGAGDLVNTFDHMHSDFHGLTKREAFAMAALQGMCADATIGEMPVSIVRHEVGLADGESYAVSVHWPIFIAKRATAHADALLAELAKDQP